MCEGVRSRVARLEMARPEGLEPPAYRFEACRSIQLSYGRARLPFYFFAAAMNASMSRAVRGAPADMIRGSPLVISTSSSIRTPIPS